MIMWSYLENSKQQEHQQHRTVESSSHRAASSIPPSIIPAHGADDEDLENLLATSDDSAGRDMGLGSFLDDNDTDDNDEGIPESLKAFVEERNSDIAKARDSFLSMVLNDQDLSMLPSGDEGDLVESTLSFPDNLAVPSILQSRSPPPRRQSREGRLSRDQVDVQNIEDGAASSRESSSKPPHLSPAPLSSPFALSTIQQPSPKTPCYRSGVDSSPAASKAPSASPSLAIIDLTGLATGLTSGLGSHDGLGSSPSQPITLDVPSSNMDRTVDTAPLPKATKSQEEEANQPQVVASGVGSLPSTLIDVVDLTQMPVENRPPRTPSSKKPTSGKSSQVSPSIQPSKNTSPSPPSSSFTKRSRVVPLPPNSQATSKHSTFPSESPSPTSTFFASLTDRLSRPTASSTIKAECKKKDAEPKESSLKSFHEANKEKHQQQQEENQQQLAKTGLEPDSGSDLPSPPNGSTGKRFSLRSPVFESSADGVEVRLETPEAPNSGSDKRKSDGVKSETGSSGGANPSHKSPQLIVVVDGLSSPQNDSRPLAPPAGSPKANAMEASRRISPKISSPSDSPDFIKRLTQHTVASKARQSNGKAKSPPSNLESAAINGHGSSVSDLPNPLKLAISPSKQRDAKLPKVLEPSSRLTSETVSSKAHHRKPPEEGTSSDFSSPVIKSSPSPVLLNRLTKETTASAARRPTRDYPSSDGKSTSPPHVLHFRYSPDATNPLENKEESQAANAEQSACVFDRLFKDTESSKARKASSPTKHVDDSRAPSYEQKDSATPPAFDFSRLAQDTESSKARKVASPTKQGDDSHQQSHEQWESKSLTISHAMASTQGQEVCLAPTKSGDEEGSFGIPNVCSSLTQDSAVSSTDLARQMEARALAKRAATVRPVASRSRLLMGTASSRARVLTTQQKSVPSHKTSDQSNQNVVAGDEGPQHMAHRASALEAIDRAHQAVMRAKKVHDEKHSKKRSIVTRPPTIPVTPSFMRMQRNIAAPGPTTIPESTTVQSTDPRHTGLRRDFKSTIIAKHASSVSRKVTVPKTPNFATAKRKSAVPVVLRRAFEPTLAQSTDVLIRGLRSDASTSSTSDRSSRRKLTVPRTPQLATVQRHGVKTVAAKRHDDKASLANSTELLQAELRTPYPSTMTRRKDSSAATIAPSLPAPRTSSTRNTTPTRKATQPVPFRFQTDRRLSTVSQAKTTVVASSEARDLEEMKKQFRARPAPKQSGPVTGTSRRSRDKATFSPTSSSDSTAQPYRSAGRATTTHPACSPRSPLTPDSNDSWTIKAARRLELAETARRNAKAMAEQREQDLKARQRESIRQGILRSEATRLSVPANAKPFTLQSELRGEQHQRRFQEKVRREMEEQRRLASFHAREYSSSPAASPAVGDRSRRRPDRIVTQAQPFRLTSVARHEEYAIEHRRRLEMEEEERRRLSQFKAKPVPKTTYASPIANSSPGRRPLSSRSVGSRGNRSANHVSPPIR
jgi:hypothetical protein